MGKLNNCHNSINKDHLGLIFFSVRVLELLSIQVKRKARWSLERLLMIFLLDLGLFPLTGGSGECDVMEIDVQTISYEKNASFQTVELLLLRSGRSEPAVSLVQDDAKDQEPSGMMNLIIEGWDKYKMSSELHLEREN